MKKSKDDKNVNKIVKHINRDIKNDVFGSRFEIRQYQKTKENGVGYYIYSLLDNKNPKRNYIIPKWLTVWDVRRVIYEELNDFIIHSDFWALEKGQPDLYDVSKDFYLNNRF